MKIDGCPHLLPDIVKSITEKANDLLGASVALMVLAAISTTVTNYLAMFFVVLAACTGTLAIAKGLKTNVTVYQLIISMLWSGLCFFTLIYGVKSYYGSRLVVAIENGDIEKIKFLVSKGYDVTADTGGGQNMLTWAFWYPYPNKTIWSDRPLKIISPEAREKRIEEILAILIDAGADPNKLDPHGQTPLDYAVSKGHKEIVEMLLKRGANSNLKNGHGDTPLIVAVEANDLGVATLLIQGGANINAKNADDKTALQIAIEQGKIDIAEYLRQHRAKK
jgi:ankyrin repeat protein